jgi:hypothetical protein
MEQDMTKDEALDLALEAGIDEWWDNGGDWRETFNEHLKAFEALVRADEREACAKVAEDKGAMVIALLNVTSQPIAIAAAIRARGNT